MASRGRTPVEKRTKLYIEQGCCCFYCGEPVKSQDLTLDHVIPKVMCDDRWEFEDHDNYVAACYTCNHNKGFWVIPWYLWLHPDIGHWLRYSFPAKKRDMLIPPDHPDAPSLVANKFEIALLRVRSHHDFFDGVTYIGPDRSRLTYDHEHR